MNAPVSPMRMIYDTLANIITGLGSVRDKSGGLAWAFTALTPDVLETMYRGDWVARKIVNAPAQDATRAWRQWQAENDQIEAIENLERQFNIQNKVYQAMVYQRLYGGAALILGVDGTGNPESELNLDDVGQDALVFVHAVPSTMLSNEGGLETDLTSPYFGIPKMFTRQIPGGPQIRIHPSRVVRLVGELFPRPDISSDGWGESVLQAIHDAVRNSGLIQQSVATLMDELKVDVIKIPELTRIVSTKEASDKLTSRLQYGMMSKSTVNALVMDKDDEWERIQQSFAGLPDVIRIYLLIAAGAADIPATRLLGQSPAGLNATGDSDIRNYYDRIASDQSTVLQPALNLLDEIIKRSALGADDPSIYYAWSPLWQMTEAEKSTIAYQKAQTHKIDVDNMLIPTDALKIGRENQLIEDGFYPGFELALEESNNEIVNPQLEQQMTLQQQSFEQSQQLAQLTPPTDPNAPPTGDAGFDPSQSRDPHGMWAKASGALDLSPADMNDLKLRTNDPDIVNAIRTYVGPDYQEINEVLRQTQNKDWQKTPYAPVISKLDEAFNWGHDLKRNATVYRGVEHGTFLDKLKIGDSFTDRAFVSTSPIRNDVEHFTFGKGVTMSIELNKGQRVLNVDTGNGDPPEILLQRRYKFTVVAREGDNIRLKAS